MFWSVVDVVHMLPLTPSYLVAQLIFAALFQVQEFNDQEYLQELQRPPSKSNDNPNTKNTNTQGFVVRNAPWHCAAPDTASTEEFPSFGSVVQPKSGHAWGPVRKN